MYVSEVCVCYMHAVYVRALPHTVVSVVGRWWMPCVLAPLSTVVNGIGALCVCCAGLQVNFPPDNWITHDELKELESLLPPRPREEVRSEDSMAEPAEEVRATDEQWDADIRAS